MKIIKSYKLFEDYINSSTEVVHTLLKNMVKMFQETFDGQNDVFGEEEKNSIVLVEVEASLEKDPMEKNIIMNFSDNLYYYQIIFIIKIEDVVPNKPIEKGYMKIKIYDSFDNKLLREWQSNLTLHVCTDDEQNNEGRFFVKVQEIGAQETPIQGEQSQSSGEGGNFIENFIISKIGDLKVPLDKKIKE